MNPVQEGEPTTRQPMRSAVLVGTVTVAALLGIAHGVLIAVEAAQQTATWIVTVPVRPTLAFPADLPITGLVLAETPDMTRMPTAFDGGLVMFLERSDPLTAVFAGVDSWITWLTVGAIVLMLLPVLRTITAGHPFAPGNAGRLAWAGVVTAVAWTIAAVLPVVAAQRAIAGELAHVSAGWFAPRFEPQWWPLGFAAFLVVLAISVRQGSRMAAETAGLV